jgi:transcriptional regulator with XRE-family HTH domain
MEVLAITDKMMSIAWKTPQEVQQELANRFKARRLSMNLTQEGLARRSGVSWSSLKRFESKGLIALDSLLKLALALECLPDFDNVCVEGGLGPTARSLDQILTRPAIRRKGRIK